MTSTIAEALTSGQWKRVANGSASVLIDNARGCRIYIGAGTPDDTTPSIPLPESGRFNGQNLSGNDGVWLRFDGVKATESRNVTVMKS